MNIKRHNRLGQTAMEYMVLLGVVVALVMVAFKTQLPRTQVSANVYFNRALQGIVGNPNPCGDGSCCTPFEDLAKCPADCASGEPSCPGAVCTNPFSPANAGACPGDDTGMLASENWMLVANGGCTSRKCEYQCNSGFMPSTDTCVPAVCSGAAGFPNATMCPGDDTGLTTGTAWAVVPNGGCTSAKCEYACNPGYVAASSADCVLAQCVGSSFGYATICPGDGTGLVVNTPRRLVASCSSPGGSAPKCEYACDGLYVFYGGSCCLPACVVNACGPGQNNGCGGTIDCPSCCGNGIINTGEQCDPRGPNLNGQSCVSLGYPVSALALTCNADCTFNVSRCSSCPALTLDIGSGLTAMFNETLDGQTFSGSCPSGYAGTPSRACGAGTWGALNNGCVPAGCPDAALNVGSGLTGIFPAAPHGNTTTLNCAAINSGYQGSTAATCDYGSWINLVAGCVPADCGSNVFMDPGAVVQGTFPASPHGTPVTLDCAAIDARYTGTFGRTCDHGGWINPVGGCVALGCPAQTLDIGSGLTGPFPAAGHGGTGYSACPVGYTGVPARVCDYGIWGPLSNGCAPVTCTCPDSSIISAGASCAGSYYQLSTVPCGGVCAPQTRTCGNDGVLTGSYTNTSCTVGACPCASPCGHGSIPNGAPDTCYSAGSVPCGGSCAPVTGAATCADGSWSPGTFTSYTSPSCSVAACAPCTCPGGPVNGQASGTSCPTAYYLSGSVPCGSTCGVPETRACFNGTLSGSYTAPGCSVAACPCTCPGGAVIADGASCPVPYYLSSSVPCGSTCGVPQTRTCGNGTLSGSYTNAACSVAVCASCTGPDGAVIAHGASRTYYQSSSSTPCGTSCVAETRTCNNGTLSGSYTFAACSFQLCCGNGFCGDSGETCSTCPTDCGACPGTWTVICVQDCHFLYGCAESGIDCSMAYSPVGMCPGNTDPVGSCTMGSICKVWTPIGATSHYVYYRCQ